MVSGSIIDGVDHVLPSASAQLHSTMWADLLDFSQELEFLLLCRFCIVDLLRLSYLISLSELPMFGSISCNLQYWYSRIVYLFRVGVK
jgi:hypothetical protein